MKVSDIKIVRQQDYCQLEGKIKMDALGGKEFLLWYRFPIEFESFIDASCSDPFVAALLLPAMVTGESVEAEVPVSPKLFNSLHTIQDIYHRWDDRLSKVSIITPEKPFLSNKAKPAQPASFFSAGVDSFYTVLKYMQSKEKENSADNLKHLILVHGFDIPVAQEYDVFFERTLANAQLAAEALGKKVLPVATNIRQWMNRFVGWGAFGHGASLASVGLTLQNLFGNIFIASTYTYANLFPWGSHPILDPLWSVESMSFIHDGCEASRLDKIRFITQFPIVLKTLRICYHINHSAPNVHLNCGHCDNCVPTMISLHIVGALKNCKVFPQTINLDLVRNLSISQPVINTSEAYHSLSSSRTDREIKAALKAAFEKANIVPTKPPVRSASYYLWKQLHVLEQQLSTFVSPAEFFILVDEEQIRMNMATIHQAIPFTEKDGKYAGEPSDAATAIMEVERLRNEGAGFMVFAWPAFWWLEHYQELDQYLRSNFSCLLENENLVLFDLRQQLTDTKSFPTIYN
jgi:hypothetical protein